MSDDTKQAIQAVETEIFELTRKLAALRKAAVPVAVPNYTFDTQTGSVSLLDLFADKTQLLVVHNMGQGCRYCTLWADGFNGFLPHLEATLSVALVSKDPPEVQRRFANARGWRFRLASHGGGDYIRDQSVLRGRDNVPGSVVYERDGDTVLRKNSTVFGPGDLYCPAWHLLALAGVGTDTFTPQYSYWQQPAELDDGGENRA
ncbi:MAG: DUF899 family protein [Pseudomonadota bacterium]